MIEMVVRTVDHSVRSGEPLVLLLPRDREAAGAVTVPVSASDACSLSHELEGLTTLRTRAYALLVQALHAVGGYVASITIEAGGQQPASAQVRVGLPRKWEDRTVDVSAALGLSVHLSLPLLVSERLAQPSVGRLA